ncbi:Bax domain protein [mine drainage metagenome]|uniref:Bax domain protein n=2 Tax=mine drainage metagenome TaxID=410659 RepID=T1ARS9_9ZZZZ
MALPAFFFWHFAIDWSKSVSASPNSLFAGPTLDPIHSRNVQTLTALYAAYGYHWPPHRLVPAIDVDHLPAGLAALPVHQKKVLFLKILLPIVLAANQKITRERHFLQRLFAAHRNRPWMKKSKPLAMAREIEEQYRVTGSLAQPAVQARLLARVDVVPEVLALAQAAKESGWGTSRFALRGNDLFGLWTDNPFVGMAPRALRKDPTHFVRVFADLRSSVRHYLRAINTRRPFAPFRAIRARMRRTHEPLNPELLAQGLDLYSQQGEDYVLSIQQMLPTLDSPSHLGRLSLVSPRVLADLIVQKRGRMPGAKPAALARVAMVWVHRPRS